MEKERFLRKIIKNAQGPVSVERAAEEFAQGLMKERSFEPVKIYNPDCKYEVGNLIYKEFNEKLRLGKSKYQEFEGHAILKVTGKKYSPEFGCFMLTLEYEGGGILREHFSYLKRAKIGFYLPSYELKECPQLPEDEDPRKEEVKPTEEIVKNAKREIIEIAKKSPDLFVWRGYIDLASKIPKVEDSFVKLVEEYMSEMGKSSSTEELVEKILGKPKEDNSFGRWCLSLSKSLEARQLTFVLVSKKGFGRWNTWVNLVNLEKDLPIRVRRKLPIFFSRSKVEIDAYMRDFERGEKKRESRNRYILSWREVLSGAVRVRRGMRNILKGELDLEGRERGKAYKLYYFPEKNYILGLGNYYRENFVVQGAQLFLEWKDDHFDLSLRKEKKPFHAPMLIYQPEGDEFILKEAELSSEMDVEKHVFITRDEIKEILDKMHEFRAIGDLTALLRELVKDFGDPEQSFRINYLKLWHVAELVQGISKEEVILSLLGNEEFVQEEEFGYFNLDLNKAAKIPVEREEKVEKRREWERKRIEVENKKIPDFVKKKKKGKRKQKKSSKVKEGFFAEKLKEAIEKKD